MLGAVDHLNYTPAGHHHLVIRAVPKHAACPPHLTHCNLPGKRLLCVSSRAHPAAGSIPARFLRTPIAHWGHPVHPTALCTRCEVRGRLDVGLSWDPRSAGSAAIPWDQKSPKQSQSFEPSCSQALLANRSKQCRESLLHSLVWECSHGNSSWWQILQAAGTVLRESTGWRLKPEWAAWLCLMLAAPRIPLDVQVIQKYHAACSSEFLWL